MKRLEGLSWRPCWVSHLGCLKGCADYLGLEVSDGWLYGGTGHAFVLNIHEMVCPSGPTAWIAEPIFRLGRNLGYVIDGAFGSRARGDLAEARAKAWEHVRAAIDRGLPCYGWELAIPEFYLIRGYDDTGYYYVGPCCEEGAGPKPWRELGDTKIGEVDVHSMAPGQAAEDAQTVQQALSFALEHAGNPEKWIFPKYRAGLEGYDAWIAALEGGHASRYGMAYNAAVWAECRQFAVAFLEEARERLGDDLASNVFIGLAGFERRAGNADDFAAGLSGPFRRRQHRPAVPTVGDGKTRLS